MEPDRRYGFASARLMDEPRIRLATADDLAAINDIYNHYVAVSTCTYEDEPCTAARRAAWFASHGDRHPVTVAECGDQIVGWASLSAFHARVGYRFTVEDSVYVRQDCQQRGLGRALLGDLLERARMLGHHTVIAGISADQGPSLALHRRFGFQEVARLREVGLKFGRWLDVIYMQWMADDPG